MPQPEPEDANAEDGKKPKPIAIHVNTKPVELGSRKVTGVEIKKAAIDQGVEIHLDFELIEEAHDEHPARIIKDNEDVTVSDHSKFVAEVKHHPVTVTVNGKAVNLLSHRVTGLEIKQAAIDQDVEIELDFELVEEPRDGKPERKIRDDEKITVTKESKFLANDAEEDS